MSEYKRPTTKAEFDKNFAQKKPLMNDTEAYYESSRCLFCYDAPCITACPTGIDIPLFIKQIHTQNNEGAAKTIFDSNWLGNACGTVCPTGVLCEGACVYNHQGVKPIDIGRLQTYATEKVLTPGKQLYTPGEDNGRKVAIIGAGPAGIACASELRVMGYAVDIFEAKKEATGLLVHGTAPYKITNEAARDEFKWLQDQLGFNVKYNNAITSKQQLEKLENEYDAVFLGVGIGPTRDLGLKGENLENVVGAVEFIEELRLNQHKIEVPEKVVVIGGGNTAMDAASETARMGAESVTLVYRRSKEEMGAYYFEYELARGAGARSIFNAQPVEILGNGKATGVRFVKTELVDARVKPIDGSEFDVEADLVIKATGQAKMGSLFSLIDQLELDNSSRLVVNDRYQTTNPKYFAGGDAINGGAEVVNAAHDGKAAAKGINNWLMERK